MTPDLVYAGVALDRAQRLRRDTAWLEARLADPESRIVPVWRERNLIAPGPPPRAAALLAADARAWLAVAEAPVLLGLEDRRAWFSIDLSPLGEADLAPLLAATGDGIAFADLRRYGAELVPSEAGVLALARGLAYWHRQHRFCGACGSPTASRHGGHVRQCLSEQCGREHFPRTDPAVIMLVVAPDPRGDRERDRCLLGRQPHWPTPMYSTLAGFVEPGESLEQAVRREVWEEAGVRVGRVSYRASQPWPFPASLMLAFQGQAISEDIMLDSSELEDARWFTRAEIRAFDGTRYALPRVDSVSRFLIEEWLNEPA